MARLRILFLLGLSLIHPALHAQPLVIAHRGASGYLPEHSLEAKVLAFAQGADFLEQDVVMTRDDQLVVLHDLTLDRISDVAEKFPQRARQDGHYYVIDFDLAELRTLRLSEGFQVRDGQQQAIYPDRFPPFKGDFRIHTLAEEIELIQGLNRNLNKNTGIYPELKSPWFHHREGKDLALAVLETLKRYGYQKKDDPVFLQTFDYHELVRLHDELLPSLAMELPLVQLIADNSWRESYEQDSEGQWRPFDYRWMHSREGLVKLATYADGIGASLNMIYKVEAGKPVSTALISLAHESGLQVHAYTFRKDRLPVYAEDFRSLLRLFIDEAGIDGLFTDFPDLTRQYLEP